MWKTADEDESSGSNVANVDTMSSADEDESSGLNVDNKSPASDCNVYKAGRWNTFWHFYSRRVSVE